MSKRNHLQAIPARDSLAKSLAGEPGFDSVGITEKDGSLALSVFLRGAAFKSAKLPAAHDGYAIVRKKASEFVPH